MDFDQKCGSHQVFGYNKNINTMETSGNYNVPKNSAKSLILSENTGISIRIIPYYTGL